MSYPSDISREKFEIIREELETFSKRTSPRKYNKCFLQKSSFVTKKRVKYKLGSFLTTAHKNDHTLKIN